MNTTGAASEVRSGPFPDKARVPYPSAGFLARLALAVVVRPTLWATAVVQMFRLARRGWWRRPPFLPIPTRDYLGFRAVTQYGGEPADAVAAMRVADVVDYLGWCRQWNRAGR